MKNFANLYLALEQESRAKRRVDTVANYFGAVSETEGAMVCSIMMGVSYDRVNEYLKNNGYERLTPQSNNN